MVPGFMLVLGLVLGVVVGCLSAIAGQLYERRKWERRTLDRAEADTANRIGDEGRMARLENAVDVIAVELERVGEGQRFVTKLLSERPRGDRTPPSPHPGAVKAVRPPI
jgi:hypothetical protein